MGKASVEVSVADDARFAGRPEREDDICIGKRVRSGVIGFDA